MKQIKIRPPQEVEYTIVNTIICEAFNIQSNSHHPEFFSNPNIHCIVAVLNDVVIGTSSLHIIQKSNRKDIVEVGDVFIEKILKSNFHINRF